MKGVASLSIFLLLFVSILNADELTYPANLAKVVKLYPDATVTGIEATTTSSNATLQVNDPVSKTVSFYKSNFEKGGWKETSYMGLPEGAMVTFSRGKELATIYAISANDSTTLILTLEW